MPAENSATHQLFKPIVIAGPCAAESSFILEEVASEIQPIAQELNFEYLFKASFDKANRSSYGSYRGPGLNLGLRMLGDIKEKFAIKVLTDIHESHQAEPVAAICDTLQIPAYLCRQTDLVAAAIHTGKNINIKKGQFVSPGAMISIGEKAKKIGEESQYGGVITITERGFSLGYGNLVVDMRAFPIIACAGLPVILDITHSTQLPPGSSGQKVSGGERNFAPILARAACATGYLSGFFLEVHPEPGKAKSDQGSQLSIDQAKSLLRQIIPLWRHVNPMTELDGNFKN